MRLIDADKLHYIRKWFEDSNKSEVVVFAKEIDKAPTVDAVPVIRCKDCKYWWQENNLCTHNKAMDGMVCALQCDAYFYCGYAERKEE